MKKIVDKQKLELIYKSGNGAWTYHIVIPNTADIDGTWGSLKVSGLLDDYELKEMNLAPRKEEDKMISINEEIRKAIGKSGGDTVTVTLYLHTHDRINKKSEIFKCFEDASVKDSFKSLNKDEQKEIMDDIISKTTEAKQIEQINHYINILLNKNN
ncbi:protein of unknown function [Salegentibacter agarivorans]|mgnify:CR=1 FL=1|jgi:hypothetical protein|uniref:Bacteriocin-protection, YdeI or OmpD-Associated n=1 Tax=Salegentibacter agarivorans TaxID=345907 RepID=A0A1I2KIB5_9FLAO|nr:MULTISPECIES: DUF1905 domain-containing protein [Salegentibacter]APS40626.1 hypothetical protein AO058_17860 [Salegentibacter sp. T436]SFF66078.1 protein of unknown function [Salegentibacter agarivorans]